MKRILIFILIFTMVFSLSIFASAAENDDLKKASQITFTNSTNTNENNGWKGGLIYYLEPNDSYYLLVYNNYTSYNEGAILFTSNGVVERYLYNKSTKSFELELTYNVESGRVATEFDNFVVGSQGYWVIDHTVYGDMTFFELPKPLHVQVQTFGNSLITDKFTNDFQSILFILVPIGVGCLAMLVLLKLFGKRTLLIRK